MIDPEMLELIQQLQAYTIQKLEEARRLMDEALERSGREMAEIRQIASETLAK